MRLAALAVVAACSDPAPERGFATYTIAAGAHLATITDGEADNPLDGVVAVDARDYELVLDPSAMYELTDPVEPTDQLDWNKLPGLSDCDSFDLAVDGAMFGWRWRIDLAPPVLEITAYANAAGVHQTPAEPLATLDAADLEARAPLHYRVARTATEYTFAIDGATTTLPRRCTDAPLGVDAWAGGFFFGGTSPAPHAITARIRERSVELRRGPLEVPRAPRREPVRREAAERVAP